MKKLFLILLGLLIILPFAGAYENYSEQGNRRDLFYYWQNSELTIQGLNQPYAKVKLFREEKLLSSINADEKGYFMFKIDTLSPQQSYYLKIEAYNYFNEKTGEDINVVINPGGQTKGQVLSEKIPIKNAFIKLIDKDGKILEKTYSDQNGYFILNSVPTSAKIVVSGQGIEAKEIEVGGDEFLTVNLEIDHSNPPTIEEEIPVADKSIASTEKTNRENIVFYGLLGSFLLVILGLFIKAYLLKKRS